MGLMTMHHDTSLSHYMQLQPLCPRGQRTSRYFHTQSRLPLTMCAQAAWRLSRMVRRAFHTALLHLKPLPKPTCRAATRLRQAFQKPFTGCALLMCFARYAGHRPAVHEILCI